MVTNFQLQRGTTARWAEVNPILLAGEPGVDLDLHILKIGDGTTPWLDLPAYSGIPGEDGQDGADSIVPGPPGLDSTVPGPPGPSAVSADEGNVATLGSDNLIFVPEPEGGGGSASEVRHSNDGTYDYLGVAPAGTDEGSSGWAVTRLTVNVSPVVENHGTGTWTGRAAIPYS